MKVWPIGYSAYGARERIEELTEQNNVLIMDTRLKPYSWRIDYRQAELKAKYGNTYHWCGRHLGNINYQSGPIKLANPDVGITGLVGYLKAGYDLILLCQCTSFDDCHMKEICRLLVEEISGIEVVKFEQTAQPRQAIPAAQRAKPKRNTLEEDVAELKELREVFEPEKMIICQRSGQGKGCTMTWASGDKVTVHIPYSGNVPGVVRETRMEGLTQKVRVTTVISAPLLGRNIISEDKRWFDGENLAPRVSFIPELGEHE